MFRHSAISAIYRIGRNTTIPNVNSSNNKFYFDKDNKEIVIPGESYKLHDINKYLKRAISKRYHEKEDASQR